MTYQYDEYGEYFPLRILQKTVKGTLEHHTAQVIVTICNFANTPIKPSTMSLLAIKESQDQGLNGRKV